LVIVAALAVSGGYLLWQPIPKNTATLRLWTFTNIHSDAYKLALPAFEAKHPGVKVDVQLVHGDAVTRRLRAAFWADLDVPDLVEVEITRAGSFFRGPVEDVGFVDLKPWLEKGGYLDRVVRTRFEPYTNRGHIFGLPHDVHPVMLGYRRDLFAQLGIDVNKLTTWDDFVREGRRVTKLGERYMVNFTDAGAHNYEMALFQRGGDYFDADGRLTMDNETALATLLWYIPLVAGPQRIASDPGMFGQPFARAVEDGYVLTFVCPDWKSKSAEKEFPQLAGQMALMPLPVMAPGGSRTSTWGGTMLGITKHCRQPELAWALAQHLYFDAEELAGRFRETNIVPPLKDAWRLPSFVEPRSFWSGQPLGKLYADLAEQVPAQHASPFLEVAKGEMSAVIAVCSAYYNRQGNDGFEAFAREKLKAAGEDVRRQMARNPF
jgi:arabinosaccharide transport system substrate-binding protein